MKTLHKLLFLVIVLAAALAGVGIGCSSDRPRSEAVATVGEGLCSGSTGMSCFATNKAVVATSGGVVVSNAKTVIDSYQSSLGPYGGANVGNHGDVQAGTIIQNGGVINGQQAANSVSTFPVIQPPSCATSLGNIVINSGQSATLSGGDYVATGFSLGGTLNITAVSTAPVRIWITGTLILGGSANVGGIPKNLQFFYTGTNDVNENSAPGGQIFALIYAPKATINLDEPHFGNVVGATVRLNSGSTMHLDQDSACVPPGTCLPSSSLSVLVGFPNPGDVRAYVPNGDWTTPVPGDGGAGESTGVKLVSLEGTVASVTIPTPNPVNSCAANSATGQVVCTGNGTDVYLLSGSTLTKTLKSGGVGLEQFSGGACTTCGVAVDELHNTAILSVATNPSDSGVPFAGGYQSLNLTDGGFGRAVPSRGPGTSEGMIIDPMRSNFVLAPVESFDDKQQANNYQLVGSTIDPSTAPIYDFRPTVADGGPLVPPYPFGVFDSAGEDCLTGLALASIEYNLSGDIFLTNMRQVTLLDAGAAWSGPANLQTLLGLETFSEGVSGIAVAPNSHLAVVTGEFGPPDNFGAILLPSALDGGPPAVVDWVAASMPVPGDGGTFDLAEDPHPVTAYVSPTTNKAFGVIENQVLNNASTPPSVNRTFAAVVDLQALLSAPRADAGPDAAHTVASGVDLVATGIVRFVPLPP